MPDILHRIGTRTAADDVYAALATQAGLAGWWTEQTTVDGDAIHFGFSDSGFFDMRVVEQRPGERVVWEVVDGPPEWIGTTITFELLVEDAWTVVHFTHAGWREPVAMMHHCSTKWGTFLMSLQRYLETGTGAPHPRDVRIDNWG